MDEAKQVKNIFEKTNKQISKITNIYQITKCDLQKKKKKS